tara:strand:- start:364 stop:777 length:414 start_codon:yes stop_codon:yes gene_type:complete
MTEAKENKQEIDFSKDFKACAKGKFPPTTGEVITTVMKLRRRIQEEKSEAEASAELWDKLDDFTDKVSFELVSITMSPSPAITPDRRLRKLLDIISDDVASEICDTSSFDNKMRDIREILEDVSRLRYRKNKEAKLK